MSGSMREKRPGRWELRVGGGKDPVTGRYKTIQRTFAGNEREARKALAKLVREVQNEEHTATSSTLGWMIDQHLEHLEVLGRSPTTLRGYRSIVKAKIRPALGDKPLDRLTAKDLDQFYVRLIRDGAAVSSVRQAHAIISGALGLAVKWDLVLDGAADVRIRLRTWQRSVPSAWTWPSTRPG